MIIYSYHYCSKLLKLIYYTIVNLKQSDELIIININRRLHFCLWILSMVFLQLQNHIHRFDLTYTNKSSKKS